MVYKVCGRCGLEKPVSEFQKRTVGWFTPTGPETGYSKLCRPCIYLRRKETPKVPTKAEKNCGKCNTVKPISEFSKNSSTHNGVSSCCKACNALETKVFYDANRERLVKKSVIAARKKKQYHLRILFRYKRRRGCCDCGFRDPRALDFDHVKGEKINCIATLVGSNWDLIKEEIKKCELRCANCHRIITFERRKEKQKHEDTLAGK